MIMLLVVCSDCKSGISSYIMFLIFLQAVLIHSISCVTSGVGQAPDQDAVPKSEERTANSGQGSNVPTSRGHEVNYGDSRILMQPLSIFSILKADRQPRNMLKEKRNRSPSPSHQYGVDLSMLGSINSAKFASPSSHGFSLSSLLSPSSHPLSLTNKNGPKSHDDPSNSRNKPEPNLMLLDISSLMPDSFRDDLPDHKFMDLDSFSNELPDPYFHPAGNQMPATAAGVRHEPHHRESNFLPDTSTYYYDPESNFVSVLPDIEWPVNDARRDYDSAWNKFAQGVNQQSGRSRGSSLYGSDGGDALTDFLQGHATDPESPFLYYHNIMRRSGGRRGSRMDDSRIRGPRGQLLGIRVMRPARHETASSSTEEGKGAGKLSQEYKNGNIVDHRIERHRADGRNNGQSKGGEESFKT